MTTRTDDQTPQTADAQCRSTRRKPMNAIWCRRCSRPRPSTARRRPSPSRRAGAGRRNGDGDRRPAGGAERGTHRRVAGLDASPAMLSVARAMAAEEGLSIEWHEGRAEALPYPDESFNLVSQFALMFFTDRAGALSEMWRVLIPGGRVALSVFQGIDRHPFYQTLDHAIERHLGMSAVGDLRARRCRGAQGVTDARGFPRRGGRSPSRSPRAFRIRTHSSPARSMSTPRRSRPCKVSILTRARPDGGNRGGHD